MWRSDSASDVALTVTLTVDIEAQFNNTIIEFTDDPGSSIISLRIQNVNDCDTANRWKANTVITLAFALLASLLITRWSTLSTWFLLIGLFVAAATLLACANNCTERTDVDVLVPR